MSGVLVGDALSRLRDLPDNHFHCCVTSPPYWGLRDYGVEGQAGLEKSPEEYVAKMVDIFPEVRRVLRDDGTLWLNLGDCYATGGGKVGKCPGGGEQGERWHGAMTQPNRMPLPGLKAKDLVGIPWRVAFALQADGWWLRGDNIWHKPNPMPSSVRDRFTTAHEYVFLLAKSERYFFDMEAVKEPFADSRRGNPGSYKSKYVARKDLARDRGDFVGNGRQPRSVWTITPKPFKEAHFATFPPELPEKCIKAGSPLGGNVLDPFGGAGTTGLVAQRLGRNWTLIELNPVYAAMAEARIGNDLAKEVA